MEFKILAKPPISGTILERHFSVSAGSNLWVKFADAVDFERCMPAEHQAPGPPR